MTNKNLLSLIHCLYNDLNFAIGFIEGATGKEHNYLRARRSEYAPVIADIESEVNTSLSRTGSYRFIGADGSMGLKHGEVYQVDLIQPALTVMHPVVCPYDTIESFERNWEKV